MFAKFFEVSVPVTRARVFMLTGIAFAKAIVASVEKIRVPHQMMHFVAMDDQEPIVTALHQRILRTTHRLQLAMILKRLSVALSSSSTCNLPFATSRSSLRVVR